jgi:thiamine pyrophosphate-dependent acetolactate synthase large subunit-like protein
MTAMAQKTVAEILVETLLAAGVKRIYGVAGDSLNGITDAVRTTKPGGMGMGLAMLMGDLLSLRQLALPVTLVVFKNNALSFVDLEMKAVGFLDCPRTCTIRILPRWPKEPGSWA